MTSFDIRMRGGKRSSTEWCSHLFDFDLVRFIFVLLLFAENFFQLDALVSSVMARAVSLPIYRQEPSRTDKNRQEPTRSFFLIDYE